MKKYENMKHGTDDFPVGIHNTICENGFALYPHIHREFEFLVMEEGRGTVYIENEKFEIKEGEGVFINSEELHIGVKTDNIKASFFAIVFAPEVFGNFAMDIIMQKYVEPVIKNKIRPKRLLDEKTVGVLRKIRNTESELEIKALLYTAWDLCIKGAEKSPDSSKTKVVEDMKAVISYIQENCGKDITLEDMADYLKISRSYLCREFKKVVHMTPFEYLLEIRIDQGCKMLENTDLSIGEIAGKCGFNSFSYFTKIFGEKVGCSPKEYRRRHGA